MVDVPILELSGWIGLSESVADRHPDMAVNIMLMEKAMVTILWLFMINSESNPPIIIS